MLKHQSAKEKIMLTFAVVFTILATVSSVTSLFCKGINVINILSIIDCVLVILYASVLYKQPHGNLMKYLMVIFAFTYGLFTALGGTGDVLLAALHVIVVVAVAFVSGRLNRYKQNVIIGIVVLAILVSLAIVDTVALSSRDNGADVPDDIKVINDSEHGAPDGNASATDDDKEQSAAPEGAGDGNMPDSLPPFVNSAISVLQLFNMTILWLAIICGYVSRYKQHSAAGLTDKGQNVE